METLIIIFIAVLGLVFGSFLNVVIYRLPRDLSLISPPSTCPKCGMRIKPYDNVPVLSWLFLRGKCRKCGNPISPIYPAVELLTAACFLLVYFVHGRTVDLSLAAGCYFAASLIALAFIDYSHQILPDHITMPGLVLFLVYSFFRSDLTFRGALIGAVSGAGFLLLIYVVYLFLRKKEGLGMGDVTMMLMVGAYLGPGGAFFTLLVASFVGSGVGIFLMTRKKKDLQFAMPFGTLLAPAAFIAALWGNRIISAYLGLFNKP